jgi:hypothetical protein
LPRLRFALGSVQVALPPPRHRVRAERVKDAPAVSACCAPKHSVIAHVSHATLQGRGVVQRPRARRRAKRNGSDFFGLRQRRDGRVRDDGARHSFRFEAAPLLAALADSRGMAPDGAAGVHEARWP